MSADQPDDLGSCGECGDLEEGGQPPVALPPQDPERRARLAALLSDRRLETDELEAQRAVAALGADAEDRRWLREQYRMDDLLSRALDPLRMDFPNRVLHARRRNNSERFVRRITASARARRRPRLRLDQTWLPAAIAAVIALGVVGLTSFALWSGGGAHADAIPGAIAGEVLNGSVQVDQQNVTQVPSDSAFTVSDQAPAEIKSGENMRVVLQPKSHAEFHVDPQGERYLTLETGSGSFQLTNQAHVQAGTAIVRSDSARVAATWSPMPEGGASTSANASAGRQLRLSVTEGQAKVQVADRSHVLQSNEALLLDVERNKVMRTRHVYHGPLRSIVHQAYSTALEVGDQRLQRSYLVTSDVQVTVDGKPVDADQLEVGDVVDMICTTDQPEKLLSVTVFKHLWMDAAH